MPSISNSERVASGGRALWYAGKRCRLITGGVVKESGFRPRASLPRVDHYRGRRLGTLLMGAVTTDHGPHPAPGSKRRVGCLKCRLVEPEPGMWVQGLCPRCARKKTANRPGVAIANRLRSGAASPRFKGMTSQVFGRLTVEEYAGDLRWKCRCECGGVTTPKGASLRSGLTRSCGCLQRDRARVSETRGAAMLKAHRFKRREALRTGIPVQNGHGKLTPDNVRSIRAECAKGVTTQRELAARYSVGRDTIRHIVNRRSWRHVV